MLAAPHYLDIDTIATSSYRRLVAQCFAKHRWILKIIVLCGLHRFFQISHDVVLFPCILGKILAASNGLESHGRLSYLLMLLLLHPCPEWPVHLETPRWWKMSSTTTVRDEANSVLASDLLLLPRLEHSGLGNGSDMALKTMHVLEYGTTRLRWHEHLLQFVFIQEA